MGKGKEKSMNKKGFCVLHTFEFFSLEMGHVFCGPKSYILSLMSSSLSSF